MKDVDSMVKLKEAEQNEKAVLTQRTLSAREMIKLIHREKSGSPSVSPPRLKRANSPRSPVVEAVQKSLKQFQKTPVGKWAMATEGGVFDINLKNSDQSEQQSSSQDSSSQVQSSSDGTPREVVLRGRRSDPAGKNGRKPPLPLGRAVKKARNIATESAVTRLQNIGKAKPKPTADINSLSKSSSSRSKERNGVGEGNGNDTFSKVMAAAAHAVARVESRTDHEDDTSLGTTFWGLAVTSPELSPKNGKNSHQRAASERQVRSQRRHQGKDQEGSFWNLMFGGRSAAAVGCTANGVRAASEPSSHRIASEYTSSIGDSGAGPVSPSLNPRFFEPVSQFAPLPAQQNVQFQQNSGQNPTTATNLNNVSEQHSAVLQTVLQQQPQLLQQIQTSKLLEQQRLQNATSVPQDPVGVPIQQLAIVKDASSRSPALNFINMQNPSTNTFTAGLVDENMSGQTSNLDSRRNSSEHGNTTCRLNNPCCAEQKQFESPPPIIHHAPPVVITLSPDQIQQLQKYGTFTATPYVFRKSKLHIPKSKPRCYKTCFD